MIRTTRWRSSSESGRSNIRRSVILFRYQVSGGIESRECDPRINRTSVVPDRPEPTMKNGAEFTMLLLRAGHRRPSMRLKRLSSGCIFKRKNGHGSYARKYASTTLALGAIRDAKSDAPAARAFQ